MDVSEQLSANPDARAPRQALNWDSLSLPPLRRLQSMALFAALYTLLVLAGHQLRVKADQVESRERSFGLWSVVDRVNDVRGEIKVDTAPGKGCRVRVMLPLAPPHRVEPRTAAQAMG